MRPEYWPTDEYSGCDPELCHPSTMHMHCDTEDEVIDAWIYSRALHVARDEIGGSLLSPRVNQRYVCITGPDGRVFRRMTTHPPG